MKRAVLGCDRNPDYSFYLPIACLFWRRMGWRPLVLLVGEPSDWLDDARHQLEVERSREVGAEIYWLDRHEGARTSTVAQVSRLFAASAPGVAEDDLLMTSDVDMLPLGPWVGGGLDEKKALHLYYANAYAGSSYVHFPMCYVAARAKVWRSIVGCLAHDERIAVGTSPRAIFSRPVAVIEAVEEVLSGSPRDEVGAWNYDERVLGEMIAKWNHPEWTQEIPRTFVEGEWRIDRSDWDGAMAEVERRGSLAGVADVHLVRPGYTDDNWPRVRRVLELALAVGDLAWVDDYRKTWAATAG